MSKNYQIDMTEGSIVKKLLQFSVPLIFSSLLQLLFNAADVIVVGRFAGDNSLAAVGSTSSLVNLLVNLFVGLSIGTTVVAANFFGAGKKQELKDTVHTAMFLSIISGIILTLIGVIGAKQILKLMQSPKEVLELATLYLQIYFSGITATMIYNFGSAILRAKGDTKRPLYFLFFAGIINVILNLIFVIFLKMDVAGVALATVISQCISAFLVVRCLIKESEEFKFDIKKLKINVPILIRIIKIGVPAGLQGIIFSLSNVIIQSSINSFGAITIAGNSAASNIEGFIFTAMNGFSQGTLTFISQNFGAKKYDRINKTIFVAQICVFLSGFIFGNLSVIFGKQLLSLYTQNSDVIASGMERLKIICTTYALCGMMDVMGNSIRGIGHSVLPMIVTLLGACGIRILWISTIFLIPRFHTCNVIFISYPISWGVTFLVHLICYFILKKKVFLSSMNYI
ncbi:MAG: MATE family efflux transporter [Spirochaetaceae bacterium]|nr:MATE family efflux transporter [Spirochaetaceae bacterium]